MTRIFFFKKNKYHAMFPQVGLINHSGGQIIRGRSQFENIGMLAAAKACGFRALTALPGDQVCS